MIQQILFVYLFCAQFLVSLSIDIDTKDCGKSKGCWFEPQGCHTDNILSCTYGATWKTALDGVIFELFGSIDELAREKPFLGRYIALAMSHDEFMVRGAKILLN